MSDRDLMGAPDEHLDPATASGYDRSVAQRFSDDEIRPAVALLAELARGGIAVEFAIGTGRLAMPLADTDTTVMGIDFSEAMLAELARKPGAERIDVTLGDMTSTQVCADASVVYLVFNTIMNLRTQRQQVACFRNAVAHLAPGGRFVIETGVPQLRRLPPGDMIVPFDVSPHHLGFEEYVDLVGQISVSHHYVIDGDRSHSSASAFRYVWPSELDLMAELAGMELEQRWADWQRSPFTGESRSHVSIWRRPEA
jgi:SAM-dependent methyltransferase